MINFSQSIPMLYSKIIKVLLVSILTIFLVGCFAIRAVSDPFQSEPTETPFTLIESTATALPAATSEPNDPPTLPPIPSQTPTETLSPTPTFTPTPTPTPTALPLTVLGDPSGFLVSDPIPNNRSRCGTVDTFDFPIDPPDAIGALWGGRDFNVFRRRYDKFHAGEDWGGVGRGSALGTEVHAIGHGVVTYAQPLGWGRDKGVIIVQHVLPQGGDVLSFYGHLDEESFLVSAGECVTRGQLLGKVGNPRTPPHLHFEIRTHAPTETLGGYYAIDPRVAGWLWPSQTIWEQRMEMLPGSVWVRSILSDNGINAPVGQYTDDRFLMIENEELVDLNLTNHLQRPAILQFLDEDGAPERVGSALIHPELPFLYLLNYDGHLASYEMPPEGINRFTRRWDLNLELNRAASILPLPGGHALLVDGQRLIAVGEFGQVEWEAEIENRLFDWFLKDDQLYLMTNGPLDTPGKLWQVSYATGVEPIAIGEGIVRRQGEMLWRYGADGIYRFNLENESNPWEKTITLAEGIVEQGDFVVLPNDNLLVAHNDPADQRLLLLDRDGALLWERSFRNQLGASQQLKEINGKIYMLSQEIVGVGLEINIYRIDVEVQTATLIFEGGTRTPVVAGTWLSEINENRLLLNISGGAMVLFDPEIANGVILAD